MTHRLRRRLQAASPADRHLASSLLSITVLIIVSRIIDTGRELAVANTFGVSDVVDAYVLAFMVPKFLVTTIADSFSVAFLPCYIRARERSGSRAAGMLLANATMRLSLGLSLLIVALAVARPVVLDLLAPSFSNEKLSLTENLYSFFLPILLLSGCSRLWATILNSAERYVLTSVAPAVVPVVGIAFLMTLANELGIRALAIGILVGSLIEAAILGNRVWSSAPRTPSRRPAVRLPLRRVVHDWWPLAVSAGLMASTIPVDQHMAAGLGSGSVSTLAFGNRLVMFIVGTSSMALSAVLFSKFSSLAEASRWAELSRLFHTWTRIIAILSVPATFALIVLSPPIVQVLFERGDFSTDDTSAVAGVQMLYLIQVPFYLVSTLCVRLVNSLRCNHWLTGVAVTNVILNVAGNMALIPHLGVRGIALSTSIVYASSTTMLVLLVRRTLARRTMLDSGLSEEKHVSGTESIIVDGTQPPKPHPPSAIATRPQPLKQVARR